MYFLSVYTYLNKLSRNASRNFISVRSYTPRRALLYVPGDNIRKLNKALTLDVDCIAMDCEDGVALNKKAEARETIRSILDEAKVIKNRNFDRAVRVNSVDSELCRDDLQALLTAKFLPDTVLLPKVESTTHIKWFSDEINSTIKGNQKVDLIMYVETAIGLIKAHEICEYSMELSRAAKFTPSAIVFGSDDLCASVGARRSEDGSELLYARQKIVLVAKAFNLQAIDRVHIEFKDLAGLKRYCKQGARMGYTGKQVIHPDQVPIVQSAFLPTEKQIQWATGLINAFVQHQNDGKGAFVYQGSMIDMPTMKQAQNVVDLLKLTLPDHP